MQFLKRLMKPFLKKKADQELEEEVRFHLEKQVELNVAAGMSLTEARRQALIEFGGVQKTKEDVHDQRKTRVFANFLQDLRYGARLLRKSPGFTAIAVSILALGIGANTAIFSVVNAILFERWPLRNQQQLVIVREATKTNEGFVVSVPNFEDYRRQQTTFEQLSLGVGQSINLSGQERPDRMIGAFVSDNFFEMLGVQAGRGRLFLPGDDKPGAAPVVVISYGAWQTRFGADSGILGREVTLNNEPYSVIGVLPKNFYLSVWSSEVYIPSRHYTSYRVDRRQKSFLVFGRIKDSVTRATATADLNTIAQRLAKDYPGENAGIRVELSGLQDIATQRVRLPLLTLLGAMAMVLLIVCANIANLLLARGGARQREVAVRSALGAARGRLVRQFLSESMLVAALGGACGTLLADGLLKVLQKITPVDISISNTAVLDVRVLLFTAGVSLLTGILFGTAPALQFSRVHLSSAMMGGDRTTGHASRDWVRSGFVVCQVALSLVLLVCAGLLVRSFHALLETSPGFAPDHLLSMEYRMPPTKYQTSEARANFHRQIAERVSHVPGVVSAAIVQALPFSGNWNQAAFEVPGQPTSAGDNGFSALYNVVTPEYFSTLGLPLLRGRMFTGHDDEKALPAAIISQSFAQKYFPNRDPIGSEVRIKDTEQLALSYGDGTTQQVIVVGVVGNAKQRSVREDLQPQIYFTYAQVPGIFGTLVVRTAMEPTSMSEAVRQAVWIVDKDQPVWKVRSVDYLIQRDTAPDRFLMLLMSALGLMALVLSALGTYGMLSSAVSQRTRELGVRMALGATSGSVLKLVLMQGLKLIGIGGALGLLGSVGATRLISKLLYGVTPGDIPTFASGIAAMFTIGLLASLMPARRATKVDPIVALRYE